MTFKDCLVAIFYQKWLGRNVWAYKGTSVVVKTSHHQVLFGFWKQSGEYTGHPIITYKWKQMY